MARGSEIIVSTNKSPRGLFRDGIVSGTPRPGTIMQIDVSEGIDDNGHFTFEVADMDGDGTRPKGPLFVLLPNDLNTWDLSGSTTNPLHRWYSAYTDGDLCRVYTPLAGEELNCMVADVAGTGATSDWSVGDILIVEDGTGLLVPTGSEEIEPFMLLEDISDTDAHTLMHVIYTGY